MSTAQPGTVSAPALGVAFLKGRIASRRVRNGKNGRVHVHTLRLPAPDEYTSPNTVEVVHSAPLGQVGDDVTVKVRIGGFGRSYKTTDDEGVEKQVATADNTLTVVE